MKYYIAILSAFASLCCYAQHLTIIDHAKIKCSYVYKEVKDTLKGDTREDLIYLQIGDECSKCFSFYTFRYDSLTSSDEGWEKMHAMVRLYIKKNPDIKNSYSEPSFDPFPRMTAYLYKNYPQGKMTVLDKVRSNCFRYEDDMNLQEWDLQEDSTKTILGHECQKATCKFRGREWTAWFALDVPISDGPWKFSGLPGLIMEVYDRGNQQYFCINGMQKVNAEPISYGIIGIDPKRIEHTTHRAFLKARYATIRNDGNPLAESIGLQLSPRKNAPRFDWIEREEKYWN